MPQRWRRLPALVLGVVGASALIRVLLLRLDDAQLATATTGGDVESDASFLVAFPPRCTQTLILEQPHKRPPLPPLALTARMVAVAWRAIPGDTTARTLHVRLAIGSSRADPQPDAESCTDRVRASLYSDTLVIAATAHTLAHKHTTPGSALDVVVEATVPCGAPHVMHVHASLEWEHWSVSTQRVTVLDNGIVWTNRLRTNGVCQEWPLAGYKRGCQAAQGFEPPDHDSNLLARSALRVPRCHGHMAVKPACADSPHLNVFRGAYKVDDGSLVERGSGALAPFFTPMRGASWASTSLPVTWQPHACALAGKDWTPESMRRMLGAGVLVFVGDSTLLETFMMVVEALQNGAWRRNRADTSHFTALNKQHVFRSRVFDVRVGATRLRFLWGGAPRASNASSMGLGSWEFATFTDQLDAFMHVDDDLRCGSQPACSPLVVFNSGLHDLLADRFAFDTYERALAAALRNLTQRGARVVVLSTMPKSQSRACSAFEQLGTPATRVLNAVARRVVGTFPGVSWADVAALRESAPWEGDGHHCTCQDFLGESTVGASCLWVMRALVTHLARLQRSRPPT